MKIIKVFLILVSLLPSAFAQHLGVIKTYVVDEAKQAVATDSLHFYVINNHSILKYNKETGKLISGWNDDEGVIKHLNSGTVIGDKLYCAHSNYPESPMAGSIEIFDVNTMQHIGCHSFGIDIGSPVWIDYHKGSWWIGFAHYTGKGSSEGKDNSWTQVVQYDLQWNKMEAWIFPAEIIQKFNGRSNSGASWGKDNHLYCTGHDEKELYVFSISDRGFTLKLEQIIDMDAEGQGIAWDRAHPGEEILYGIKRSVNQVVVMKFLR